MSGFIRAHARQAAMALAMLLSVVAVSPVLAYARGLSFTAAPAVARAHATAVPAGTYWLGGITSQADPVVAAVSHRGTSVDTRVALDMTCGSDRVVFTDRTFPLPIRPNGAVPGFNITIPADVKDGILGGFDRFGGQMNKARTRLTGHWHLQLVFKNTDGTTETCDSGAVSFTAS